LAELRLLGARARGRTTRNAKLAPWQVRRATEYLQDHFDQDVRLEIVAQIVGLSPFHFARAFKESVGMPPQRYQLFVRLERARALLESGALTVSDVAERVGYQSLQSFTRAFRRAVGVPPGRWRRHLGGEETVAASLAAGVPPRPAPGRA